MQDVKFSDEYIFPQRRYFDSKDNPEAIFAVAEQQALANKIKDGTLFVKFINGDRKGSIARVKFDPDYLIGDKVHLRQSMGSVRTVVRYEVYPHYFYLIATWDKRKNKCKIIIPDSDVVLLPNYAGPTIYQMFDKKAAREEALKNVNEIDIDGKILSVGDKVLYINARYGYGFSLSHGVIQEFKAAADSRGHSISTIVREESSNQLSTISDSGIMIWKK